MKQDAANNEVTGNQPLFLHTKRALMWPHAEFTQLFYKWIMTSDK
jgi:hypothetical protein